MKVKYKDKEYNYDYKTISLPIKLHTKLKELAAKESISITRFLRKTFK